MHEIFAQFFSSLRVWLENQDSSPVWLTLIGAVFSSFAGAYGAQYLAGKTKKQEDFTSEIRSVNSAIILSYNICNTMYGIKDQQSQILKNSFDKQRSDLEKAKKAYAEGKLPADYIFKFDADYKVMMVPALPISRLLQLVFEKMNATDKILGAVSVLEQTIVSLNEVVIRHTEMIKFIKENAADDPEEMAHLYFGLEADDGNQDSRHAQCVEAIYGYTNDIIFYSSELCKDLNKYGQGCLKKFKNKKIKINNPNFSIAESRGLAPSREEYRHWLRSFGESI